MIVKRRFYTIETYRAAGEKPEYEMHFSFYWTATEKDTFTVKAMLKEIAVVFRAALLDLARCKRAKDAEYYVENPGSYFRPWVKHRKHCKRNGSRK